MTNSFSRSNQWMGHHEWGLTRKLMYQSVLYSTFYVCKMDFSVKVFLSEKGLFLMIPVKRNTAHCVLHCAVSRKIASIFFYIYFLFLLSFSLYFDQGRRSCPRASCNCIKGLLKKEIFWKGFLEKDFTLFPTSISVIFLHTNLLATGFCNNNPVKRKLVSNLT